MNLGKNSFINTLAQAQAVTHPSDTEISVLGPNNNIIYTNYTILSITPPVK